MGSFRITAIGEILWDVYPDKKRLGGAPFNFIYHVWKILGSANFISSIGNDENGKEILDFLNEKNFPTDFIYTDQEHPTGTVTVKLNDDKTPQFIISAECCYDFIELNEDSKKLFNEGTDILYFGTLSQRGEVSRKTFKSLFGKNIKYFCDLNLRHNFFSEEMIETALYASNVIKLNIDELDKLKNIFYLDSDYVKAMEQLKEKYNIDLISVTLGENGALLFDGNELDKYKAEAKNIVDTVGAGDAFAAILCAGYLKNLNVKEINKLANEFAVQICSVNGAIPAEDSVYSNYIKKLR
jgi:fructokinase